MNRRDFLKMTTLGAAATVAGVAHTVSARTKTPEAPFRGRVTSAGKGLADVIVSDGLNCVKTKADGSFELPFRREARFVTVTVPSGYSVPFHFRPAQTSRNVFDFSLDRCAATDGKGCRFVQIADSEINNASADNRSWCAKVKRIAADASAAFVIHTGDICRMEGMLSHVKILNAEILGRPMHYCIGNHDYAEGEYGERMFETIYGPSWYSFEAGGIHFVVTPMIECWDYEPGFTEDGIADWLRNDLALAKGKPVIVFSHAIFHQRNEKEAGLVIGRERPLRLKEACDFRGFVYGHEHENFLFRNGGVPLVTATNPQFGGISGAPNCTKVFNVAANGDFTIDTYYGFHAPNSWEISTAGAKWERKLPAPVLFTTPLAMKNRVFVGCTDDENRGTGAVFALDPRTGSVLWRKKTGSIKNRFAFVSGNPIVQDAEGTVTSFTSGGVQNWSRRLPYTGDVMMSAPVVTPDGSGVVVGFGPNLSMLDACTGAVRWQGGWSGPRGAIAPAIGGGKVVCSCTWRGIKCFDEKTGRLCWKKDGFPFGFAGPDPLIVGDKVIVVSRMHLVEFDLASGRMLRQKELHEFEQIPLGPILAIGGRYHFGSVNGGLMAVDAGTLDVLWHGRVDQSLVALGQYVWGGCMVNTSPVQVDARTLAAACGDGTIRFWDRADGKEIRRIKTGAPYLAGVAVENGRLFAADLAGMVRMFAV